MNILATIAAHKRLEVAGRMEHSSEAMLRRSPLFERETLSLRESLTRPDASGIIAEFKRMSPSKGMINDQCKVDEVTKGYATAGASGLSVLTDKRFFGGSSDDLISARNVNNIPILRKDFMVDPYQVIEAKAIGADVILLIAAILSPELTLEMATLARSMGMETILEVHGLSELDQMNDQITILGVNNRNLADFTVSLDISLELAKHIPAGVLAISESGIRNPADVQLLKHAGYRGFLVGEQFMSTADPAAACETFISQIRSEGQA